MNAIFAMILGICIGYFIRYQLVKSKEEKLRQEIHSLNMRLIDVRGKRK